ncbi:MAG: hypothetical protein ABI780_05260 [Ardenticatenales bacterium]
MSAAPPAGSLRRYFALEAGRTPRRLDGAVAIGAVVVVLATHALMARLPAGLIHFLEQAFRIKGLASVIVANDLLAAYFATFFVGLIGVLEATVGAREANRLEIVLAKPVRARVLLAARSAPVLLAAAVVGAVVSLAVAVSIRAYLVPGDPLTTSASLGSCLFMVALALLCLAVLLPLFVRMRDGFHALLAAIILWLIPLMPTAVFIYRPDVFDGHPGLADWIVMPSLLWHGAAVAWFGPAALVGAALVCAAMVAVAGAVLERVGVG